MTDNSLAAHRRAANNARAMGHHHDRSETAAETANGSTADGAFEAPPPLFRFRLRHMFGWIAAASVFLAVLLAADAITATLLILAASVVVMHVSATVVSSRLRAHTDEQMQRVHRSVPEAGASPQIGAATAPARCSPLQERASTKQRLPRLALWSVACGAVAGGLSVEALEGPGASAAGIGVGAVSVAIMAGWSAFIGGNFYGMFRRGWSHALAHSTVDE